jgi:hypothetical protein
VLGNGVQYYWLENHHGRFDRFLHVRANHLLWDDRCDVRVVQSVPASALPLTRELERLSPRSLEVVLRWIQLQLGERPLYRARMVDQNDLKG